MRNSTITAIAALVAGIAIFLSIGTGVKLPNIQIEIPDMPRLPRVDVPELPRIDIPRTEAPKQPPIFDTTPISYTELQAMSAGADLIEAIGGLGPGECIHATAGLFVGLEICFDSRTLYKGIFRERDDYKHPFVHNRVLRDNGKQIGWINHGECTPRAGEYYCPGMTIDLRGVGGE